jgi:hypothetical protein
VIFSIGSATSFAAVQLCRPTERAPLNDRSPEQSTDGNALFCRDGCGSLASEDRLANDRLNGGSAALFLAWALGPAAGQHLLTNCDSDGQSGPASVQPGSQQDAHGAYLTLLPPSSNLRMFTDRYSPLDIDKNARPQAWTLTVGLLPIWPVTDTG